MKRRAFMTVVGGGVGAAGYGGTAVAQDPALFEVTSTSTNSPVGPNGLLEVTATIENVGGETGRTDIELVVGYSPAVEDRQMLTLAPGEQQTITLEFRAGQPSGGREEFPVRVATGAHTVTEMVVVEEGGGSGPALFEVMNTSTNSPVGAYEVLDVTATIENVGGERGGTDIELVVGWSPAVEDSEMLWLSPGERETITLQFRAGNPSGGREEFPVRVDTGAHTVSEMVVVT